MRDLATGLDYGDAPMVHHSGSGTASGNPGGSTAGEKKKKKTPLMDPTRATPIIKPTSAAARTWLRMTGMIVNFTFKLPNIPRASDSVPAVVLLGSSVSLIPSTEPFEGPRTAAEAPQLGILSWLAVVEA